MRWSRLLRLGCLITALGLVPDTTKAQCSTWKEGFNVGGIGGDVYALATFDDGSGPALYAAGFFYFAGSATGLSIAKYDGTSWSGVGGGLGLGVVYALTVFDDGSGSALYAAGDFQFAGGLPVNQIAKWDGVTWSALGSGVNNIATSLGTFDDGSGPALYVGGFFNTAGGVSAQRVARWNGTSWSGVGGGTSAEPYAFAVYDDGSGDALYAGGAFTSAGGIAASRVAKWNGVAWSALGVGVSATVFSLAAFDDGQGTGPSLFVGGEFAAAGGMTSFGIARWDGASWLGVGGGTASGPVSTMVVHDDGSGPALYAGGGFVGIGGVIAHYVARWNGASWSTLSSGMDNGVGALAVHDDGSGPALYAGGGFELSGGTITHNVAKWDGASWSALQPGHGLNGWIQALLAWDDGSGTALYAGGGFTQAGTALASRIARWDGTTWSTLGQNININGGIQALAVFDDGTGSALYAGGIILQPIVGTTSYHIARWNGASWSSVGVGTNSTVQALAVFDDGSGPALYAAGHFTTAGGTNASRVARWDGTSWSSLGIGVNSFAYALAVYDDGTGPALYVGGAFTSAGGVANTNHLAKWNGTAWSSVGTGTNSSVEALEVFDDGAGPALYVGGFFTTAGGVSANGIARWNGTSWSSVGGGVTGTNSGILALGQFDDGSGPALYAGGSFTSAGGTSVSDVARWNGATWSALGTGVSGSSSAVAAFGTFDDGSDAAPDLYLGGGFNTAGGHGSICIAEWTGCPNPTPYCFGDGSGAPCPCGNNSAPGGGAGCLSSLLVGGKLSGSGVASLSADSLVLGGSQMPNASVLYFQGTSQVAGGIGAAFGDGLRCAGGTVTRLGTRMNVAGASSFPGAGNPPISVQGHVVAAGTRNYQAWYRNAAAFCTSAAFNATNAVRVRWVP